MYYIGLVILGSIALFGVFFLVRPPKRKPATIEMFRSFRSLLNGNQKAYWLITGCESSIRAVCEAHRL